MNLGIIVAIVACGVFVAIAIKVFSADNRARGELSSARRRAIADVSDGERVRIVGRAVTAQTVRAPLSGRACAYWRVLVEEDSGESGWGTVIDHAEGVDFHVEDGTGRARVDTSKVKAILIRDHTRESGFGKDATPELEAFLASHGRTSAGWLFNKTLRYREGIVEAGETVAVAGFARWEPDPERAPSATGYREVAPARRVVIEGGGQGHVLISDEPELTG